MLHCLTPTNTSWEKIARQRAALALRALAEVLAGFRPRHRLLARAAKVGERKAIAWAF
jgi:hypothetical protein